MDTQLQSFSQVIKGERPVMVDFSAEWCGPCKMMPPVLKELKSMVGDSAMIIKVDIDKQPQIASAYHVQSVPTMILFKKGEVKWRQSGVTTARQLLQVIEKEK